MVQVMAWCRQKKLESTILNVYRSQFLCMIDKSNTYNTCTAVYRGGLIQGRGCYGLDMPTSKTIL